MITPTGPFKPVPRGDQLVPFHTAMLFVKIPPMLEKAPPAYTLFPTTATALIELFSLVKPG
jgi:hypothetical protein